MSPDPAALLLRCPDPHHKGAFEWGWDGTRLWSRPTDGSDAWSPATRIHVTPKRVQAIHGLMRDHARRTRKVKKANREARRRERQAAEAAVA